MAKLFCEGFETALGTIADGLSRPRTEKRITKLWERIGRLKEKSHGIGQHYHIELQADESGKIATALTWMKSATSLEAGRAVLLLSGTGMPSDPVITVKNGVAAIIVGISSGQTFSTPAPIQSTPRGMLYWREVIN